MSLGGRRTFDRGQLPGPLLQALKLVLLVLLVFRSVATSASNANPAISTGTFVELDQPEVSAQPLERAEGYEQNRHPFISKSHMVVVLLAITVFALLCSMKASRKAANLKDGWTFSVDAVVVASLRLLRKPMRAQHCHDVPVIRSFDYACPE